MKQFASPETKIPRQSTAGFFSQPKLNAKPAITRKLTWWEFFFGVDEPPPEPLNACEGNKLIYINPKDEYDFFTKAFGGTVTAGADFSTLTTCELKC